MRRHVLYCLVAVACGSSENAYDGPPLLSETGLYKDLKAGTLSDGVRAFAPEFELWSDGATKQRWLQLPAGTKIDTADMDAWKYPVGTKAWKEFTRDGKRIETRLLEKVGPAKTDWRMGAYVWRDDGTDADIAAEGAPNAKETTHDVPAVKDCKACHAGLPDVLAGVTAIQLDHPGDDLNLGKLNAESLLTVAATPPYEPPGDEQTSKALGYLHANCGLCHNASTFYEGGPRVELWLSVNSLAKPEDTPTYKTSLGKTTAVKEQLADSTATLLVKAGDPDASLLHIRMLRRAPAKGGMPWLASETVDTDGAAIVANWIRGLTN